MADPPPPCEVVLSSDAANSNMVAEVLQLVATESSGVCAHVSLFSKSGGCSVLTASPLVQGNATAAALTFDCEDVADVGSEQHAYAYHVATHWDSLAAKIIFAPLPMSTAQRAFLERALKAVDPEKIGDDEPEHALAHGYYSCMPSHAVGSGLEEALEANGQGPGYGVAGTRSEQYADRLGTVCADGTYHTSSLFGAGGCATMVEYTFRDPPPEMAMAVPSPLGAWAAHHLLLSAATASLLGRVPVCHEGAACTSRAYIHARPRAAFENVVAQLAAGGPLEAAHYMERLMLAAYGPPFASYADPVPVPDTGDANYNSEVWIVFGMLAVGGVVLVLALIGCYRARAATQRGVSAHKGRRPAGEATALMVGQ